MASKDNKTSKTARVMNLLSKKADPAEEPAVEAGQPAAEAASAPMPPIVSSLAPDAAVSTQIKNALEDALEGELGAQQPAAPAPVMDEPAAPAQPAPTAAEPEPAPQAAAPAPAPAAEEPAATVWTEPLKPINPGYINVMQVLVEEKAPKYVQLFGLCSCARCMEDVKALTLNNLPSKYVVLEQGDLVPRLTVYENKFSSDIIAQMLKACRMVMEHPHHDR